MVYVVPLLCFVIALILGVTLLRRQMGWVILVALLAGVGAIVWSIQTGQKHQGWDGIGYAIFAFLMVAPAMLGISLGGVIGWLRARRAKS